MARDDSKYKERVDEILNQHPPEKRERLRGTVLAMLKSSEKELPREIRKNDDPERQVVKQILQWCELNDWSVSVINSSSVYSERENRYLTAQAPKGYPDISGCTNLGAGAFLEIKAPGRRSTMSDDQLQFLLEKINRGSFAGVFDSVDLLETTYLEWLEADDKKSFLLKNLPRTTLKKRADDDINPFDGL